MLYSIVVIVLLNTVFPEEPVYTLKDVLTRVKSSNYSVRQEAEKVYRAKENIQVALGNLLPHFNMRDLLTYPMAGPMVLIMMAGDFVPFLFPSNWFQWKKQKFLLEAEKKSFAILRRNEVNAVENLFYVILRDGALLKLLIKQKEWLQKIEPLIESKEQLGLLLPGSIPKWKIEIIHLEEDLQKMKTLVDQEKTEFLFALALPPSQFHFVLGSPTYALELTPLPLQNLIQEAQTKSLELESIDFLMKAAKASVKKTTYGFLDPNSQDVFGFGYASSIRIEKSNLKELEIKKQEMVSRIEQKVTETLLLEKNALISNALAEEGLKNSQKVYELLEMKLASYEKFDDSNFLEDFLKITRELLIFEAHRVSAIFLFHSSRARLDRLLLQGVYENLEAAFPR